MHSTGPQGIQQPCQSVNHSRVVVKLNVRPPRTAAEYFARPPRQRESLIKSAHVLSAMRAESVSLRKASREHGVSPETVRRYAGAALRKTSRGTYKARANDTILRPLVLPTPDGLTEIVTRNSRIAARG